MRGVLAEAADLARNAADHATDATAIAGWYSALLRAALQSPAAHALAPGGTLTLTGAAARDDALPPHHSLGSPCWSATTMFLTPAR